jgi:hypothetical protein
MSPIASHHAEPRGNASELSHQGAEIAPVGASILTSTVAAVSETFSSADRNARLLLLPMAKTAARLAISTLPSAVPSTPNPLLMSHADTPRNARTTMKPSVGPKNPKNISPLSSLRRCWSWQIYSSNNLLALPGTRFSQASMSSGVRGGFPPIGVTLVNSLFIKSSFYPARSASCSARLVLWLITELSVTRTAGSSSSSPATSSQTRPSAIPNTPWPPARRSATSSGDVHS